MILFVVVVALAVDIAAATPISCDALTIQYKPTGRGTAWGRGHKAPYLPSCNACHEWCKTPTARMGLDIKYWWYGGYPGAYECICMISYTAGTLHRNRDLCSGPIDCIAEDCGTNNGGCGDHATCSKGSIYGKVTCTCDDGYELSGKSCQALETCAKDNGGCDEHATCTEDQDKVTCKCNDGYTGTGKKCEAAEIIVTSGTCTRGIVSKEDCIEAKKERKYEFRVLRLPGNPKYPAGCYFREEIGRMFYNEYKSSKAPCTPTRKCICKNV